jgi:nicotinamidase-related amidase
MTELDVPVRFYRDYPEAYDYGFETLQLELERSAFLLVDVDWDAIEPVRTISREAIAPALEAARAAGMLVTYVHNDLRLVAEPGGQIAEFWTKTKNMAGLVQWQAKEANWQPHYMECLRPLPNERNFPKWIWSGFRDTFLDHYFRSLDIKNLFAVGYSQRACLHYTLAEAMGLNYRVILLRDCTYAQEMPDTELPGSPDYGWINRVTLRNIEHLVGYTTTSSELINALKHAEHGSRN